MGGRGDILLNCEMTEELADFGLAHFVRMTFPVKQNEAANPIDVSFFRSNGIVFRTQSPADAIKQLR
jgi:hypothetical protein